MKKNKVIVTLLVIITVLLIAILGFGYYKYMGLEKDYNKLTDENKAITEELNSLKEAQEQVKAAEEEAKTTETTKELNNFTYDPNSIGFGYGRVQVTGYVTVENLTSFGESGDYIYFHVMSAGDDDFITYLNSFHTTYLVKGKSLGLGCVQNGIIVRLNYSDKLGYKAFKMSKTDSDKILNSTKDKPITLNLRKLKLSEGHEADLCYSHMTYVSIAE